jgi:DNA-binding NarL/FixJ family response regulator
MKKSITVLLIEDSPDYAALVQQWLSLRTDVTFFLNWTGSLQAGLNRVKHGGVEVILLDLGLPDSNGLETFTRTKLQASGVPIIILTGDSSEQLALQMVQDGAQDYIVKNSSNGESLAKAIQYAVLRTAGRPEKTKAMNGADSNWAENNMGRHDVDVRSAPMSEPVTIAKTISLCDTQPMTSEGIRTLLSSYPDLQFLQGTDSLSQALESARRSPPDVLILDKAFGIQAILDWLAASSTGSEGKTRAGIVIWGASVTEAEALRFLQAGARGILRKSAGAAAVVACLRTVAGGRTWMQDGIFCSSVRPDSYSELTAREQQVVELVRQGFKTKKIAEDLGIGPGTVKIHLKHIFQKTGVRGRYGLALNGWREPRATAIPAAVPSWTPTDRLGIDF